MDEITMGRMVERVDSGSVFQPVLYMDFSVTMLRVGMGDGQGGVRWLTAQDRDFRLYEVAPEMFKTEFRPFVAGGVR